MVVVENGTDAIPVCRAQVHALGHVRDAKDGVTIGGVPSPKVDPANTPKDLFRQGGCVVEPVGLGAVSCSCCC